MPTIITHSEAYHPAIPQFVPPDALPASRGHDGTAFASTVQDILSRGRRDNNLVITKEGLPSPDTEKKIPNEAIEPIVEALAKSRKILSLSYDWDDAGSPGYIEDTWERARNFLLKNARCLWIENQTRINAPKILPGPVGSIDIHWKTKRRELLINIPEEPNEPASYYGDNEIGQIVKGTLDTSENYRWLWMWLIQ